LLGHEGLRRAWLEPGQLDQATQEQLQGRMIAALDRADFWTLTRQARPSPLPRTFAETPFLARSGSQVGKSPLYYLIPALITRLDGHWAPLWAKPTFIRWCSINLTS